MWVIIKDGQIDVRREPLPELERMQKIVGGYIEDIIRYKTPTSIIQVYANEEGDLLGLPDNFYIDRIQTVIKGSAILVGLNRLGEEVHLSKDDIDRIELMETLTGIPALYIIDSLPQ